MYLPADWLVPTVVIASVLSVLVFMGTYLALQRLYSRGEPTRPVDLEKQEAPVRRLMVEGGRTVPATPTSIPPDWPTTVSDRASTRCSIRPMAPMSATQPSLRSISPSYANSVRSSRDAAEPRSSFDRPTKPATVRSPKLHQITPSIYATMRRDGTSWLDMPSKIDPIVLEFPSPPSTSFTERLHSTGSRRRCHKKLTKSRPSREKDRRGRSSRLSSLVRQSAASNLPSETDRRDGTWGSPNPSRTFAGTLRPMGVVYLPVKPGRRSTSSDSAGGLSYVRPRASSLDGYPNDNRPGLSFRLPRRAASVASTSSRASNACKALPALPRSPSPTLQNWGDVRRRELERHRAEEQSSRIGSRISAVHVPLPTIVEPEVIQPRSPHSPRNSLASTWGDEVPRLPLPGTGPKCSDSPVTPASLEVTPSGSARTSTVSLVSEVSAVCTTSQKIAAGQGPTRVGSGRVSQFTLPVPETDERRSSIDIR